VHGQLISGVELPHATVQSEDCVQSPVQPLPHEPSTSPWPVATNVQLPPVQLTSQHVESLHVNVQPPPGQSNVQSDIPLHVIAQLPSGQVRLQSFAHVQLALPPLPWPLSHAPVSSEASLGLDVLSSMIACASKCGPSSPPDELEKPIRPHAASASTNAPPRTAQRYYESIAARCRRTCGEHEAIARAPTGVSWK
jgi:hypothetical protein